MDPESDYHEIWLLDLLYEFPWDLDIGYWLAFYNTITPPDDAKMLMRTGDMMHDTQRRLDNMASLMWEMFRNGFSHSRGKAAARQMNRIHKNSVKHVNAAGEQKPLAGVEGRTRIVACGIEKPHRRAGPLEARDVVGLRPRDRNEWMSHIRTGTAQPIRSSARVSCRRR
jgi:hypothetical protein